MASLIKDISINARPSDVWDALRDFAAVHERLAAGFVTQSEMDGPDTREITFFNGAVAREQLVGIDEQALRLAYTVVDGPLGATHHNASAQVIGDGDGRSRFVWITDVLPDSVAPVVAELMEHGGNAIKRTLEAEASRT